MPRPSVEAERREQILDATCDVLADAGLSGLRLANVAKAAGVSSGMIHYYFDSKRDLVAAAFEYNLTESLERHRWLLESGKDPLRVLQDLVESYLPGDEPSVRGWKVWVTLWAEATRDPALQELNERLYGRWRDLVTDVIRRAQDDGLARPGDPQRLANMLVGMLDGLAVQALLHASTMSLDAMRETCAGFIEAAVAVG